MHPFKSATVNCTGARACSSGPAYKGLRVMKCTELMRGMVISRRDWLSLTAVNRLACLAALGRAAVGQSAGRSVRESRIVRMIQAYEKQGYHRTGTLADRISGDWL